jgi:RNA polymerase sigma-70 factor (ECF subfamily)
MALKHGDELQGWEIAVAKKLIGEFRRRSRSLNREDFDDLLQECLAHWLEVRQKLDPDPNGRPMAYMARVVRNKLIDLARERESAKRRGDLDSVSLDETVSESDDAPTFSDLVDAASSSQPGEEGSLDPDDARIDLAKAMQRLTPHQRRLCELLIQHGFNVKEVAEQLRIPRGTLYEEIKRIRKVFADQGLGEYLKR